MLHSYSTVDKNTTKSEDNSTVGRIGPEDRIIGGKNENEDDETSKTDDKNNNKSKDIEGNDEKILNEQSDEDESPVDEDADYAEKKKEKTSRGKNKKSHKNSKDWLTVAWKYKLPFSAQARKSSIFSYLN